MGWRWATPFSGRELGTQNKYACAYSFALGYELSREQVGQNDQSMLVPVAHSRAVYLYNEQNLAGGPKVSGTASLETKQQLAYPVPYTESFELHFTTQPCNCLARQDMNCQTYDDLVSGHPH